MVMTHLAHMTKKKKKDEEKLKITEPYQIPEAFDPRPKEERDAPKPWEPEFWENIKPGSVEKGTSKKEPTIKTAFDTLQEQRIKDQKELQRAHYLISEGQKLNQLERDKLWTQMLSSAGATEDLVSSKMTGEDLRRQQIAAELLSSGAEAGAVPGQEQPTGATTPIDYKQAFLSTFADPGTYTKAAKMAAVGATGGAIVGSAVPGIGTAVGTIVGGAGGILVSVADSILDNVKTQRQGTAAAYEARLTKGIPNLNKWVALMDADPDNAPLYYGYYQDQLGLIEQAYSQLSIDSRSDLNLALSEDGTRRLAKFEIFYSPGGMRDYLDLKMRNALAAPDEQRGYKGLLMSQESWDLE